MSRIIGHRRALIVGLLGVAAGHLAIVTCKAQAQLQAKDKAGVQDRRQLNAQPLDLSSAVQEAAKGTKPDEAILKAASLRDEKAARELIEKFLEEAKTKKNRKPGLLDSSEMNQVLVLDYSLPEYHVRLAESYLSEVEDYKSKNDVPRAEFVWQHLEWLRLEGADKKLDDRVAEIRKRAPPRARGAS